MDAGYLLPTTLIDLSQDGTRMHGARSVTWTHMDGEFDERSVNVSPVHQRGPFVRKRRQEQCSNTQTN